MHVEVLYFDKCPTYVAAMRTLREVLFELGVEAEVELVAVNTDEEARRPRRPLPGTWVNKGRASERAGV